MKPDRFLRLQEVLFRVGISRSSVYKLMEVGQFPAQIKIGYSSVWSERAIVEWMEAQVAASLSADSAELSQYSHPANSSLNQEASDAAK